jgi:trehalose/maltose hydrolase-like predicted phosphorylase
MNLHSKETQKVQCRSDRLDQVRQPSARAGLHLTLRYRVHPAIADIVAGFAGLGVKSGEFTIAPIKPERSDS